MADDGTRSLSVVVTAGTPAGGTAEHVSVVTNANTSSKVDLAGEGSSTHVIPWRGKLERKMAGGKIIR